MNSDIYDRLTTVGLFKDLSREEIADILDAVGAKFCTCDKDEVIAEEGSKVKWAMLVMSGRIKVFEPAAFDRRIATRIGRVGQLLGATLTLANLKRCPGTIMATEPSELLLLDIAKLGKLCADGTYPKLTANFNAIISSDIFSFWRMRSLASCKRTEDRFMMYLRWCMLESGESEVKVPFKNSEQCAQYLDVTRTSLSLSFTKLVNGGQISRPGRNRFVVTADEQKA